LRSYTSELIGRTRLVQLKKIPQSKPQIVVKLIAVTPSCALFYGGFPGLPSYSNNAGCDERRRADFLSPEKRLENSDRLIVMTHY